MTLAEIVADGKELCAAVVDVEPDRAPAFLVDAALVGYARQHLARLLAIAEAAVEWDEANVFLQCERQKADPDPLVIEKQLARYYAANFALRIAVRGDAASGGQP